MKPAPFRYARAGSLAEATALLAAEPGEAKLLAGGQSLVPLLNMRLARPAVLVDLNGVRELRGITPSPDGGLRIGALTRHTELATSAAVRERAPLLAEAARHVGHAAIRNRGTLGGSVAHADPAAELPAALVALDARLRVTGPRGARVIAAALFFRGLLATALETDEILTEVLVPAAEPGWGFVEIARRPGDFALAGVAAGGFLGAHVLITAALTFGHRAYTGSLAAYGAALAYDLGANVLSAEWLFRGAIFSWGWRRFSFWPAALVSTALAVLRYLLDPALPAAVEARAGAIFYLGLVGLVGCALRAWSGSLLPGYLAGLAFFAAYRVLAS